VAVVVAVPVSALVRVLLALVRVFLALVRVFLVFVRVFVLVLLLGSVPPAVVVVVVFGHARNAFQPIRRRRLELVGFSRAEAVIVVDERHTLGHGHQRIGKGGIGHVIGWIQ